MYIANSFVPGTCGGPYAQRGGCSDTRYHMLVESPGCFNYGQLLERLFTNPGRNDQIDETPYRGHGAAELKCHWECQCNYMASLLRSGRGTALLRIEDILQEFEATLMKEKAEDQECKDKRAPCKMWKTKQGIMRIKQPADSAGSTGT